MEIEHEKNKELREKQILQLEFEEKRNNQKLELMNHEHELKMARLSKQLEIANAGGDQDAIHTGESD